MATRYSTYTSVEPVEGLTPGLAVDILPLVNDEATPITLGMAVYMNSATGEVGKADASVVAKAHFLGAVADASIAAATSGNIQTSGKIFIPAGLQIGTWDEGDRVFVSTTVSGSYRNTAPSSSGNFIIPVGRVVVIGDPATVQITFGTIVEVG